MCAIALKAQATVDTLSVSLRYGYLYAGKKKHHKKSKKQLLQTAVASEQK